MKKNNTIFKNEFEWRGIYFKYIEDVGFGYWVGNTTNDPNDEITISTCADPNKLIARLPVEIPNPSGCMGPLRAEGWGGNPILALEDAINSNRETIKKIKKEIKRFEQYISEIEKTPLR